MQRLLNRAAWDAFAAMSESDRSRRSRIASHWNETYLTNNKGLTGASEEVK